MLCVTLGYDICHKGVPVYLNAHNTTLHLTHEMSDHANNIK